MLKYTNMTQINIVAVTACPSGIAHTYMSAESLKKEAEKRGYNFRVETQGSVGIEDELSAEEIANATVVILTKDLPIINENRFAGKPTIKVPVNDCIKNPASIIDAITNQFG
jgi:fructose-specific PTS system IIB-like component